MLFLKVEIYLAHIRKSVPLMNARKANFYNISTCKILGYEISATSLLFALVRLSLYAYSLQKVLTGK